MSHTQPLSLQAGPISLLFDNGALRYLRIAGREVLRRVEMTVRDSDWNTLVPVIEDLRLEQSDSAFSISFCAATSDPVPFAWTAEISGGSKGSICYRISGRALSDFRRNRIGFCVLHPIRECSGAPCTVTHATGEVTTSCFPEAISPSQPFRNMRAISHEVLPGLCATVTFAGEVFEMEDQRNWTDSSFKTYGTPLELPFPVCVAAGARIDQFVRLDLSGYPKQRILPKPERVIISCDINRRYGLPPLGLERTPASPLGSTEVERLRALHLSHLRIETRLFDPGFRRDLQNGISDAKALDLPIELAIFFGPDPETEAEELAVFLEEKAPPIARWMVFHRTERVTDPAHVRLARKQLAAIAPKAPFIAGSNAYFAEVNRSDVDTENFDGLCFSVNPQVHGHDDLTLVENIESQADVVRSARALAHSMPVHVSPITLRPRFNPNATGAALDMARDDDPGQDPRQFTAFNGAWTMASLSRMASAGVSSLTFHALKGPRGVMDDQHSCPVYRVLQSIGAFRSAELIACRSSYPLAVQAMLLADRSRRRLLLANFTREDQHVLLTGLQLSRDFSAVHLNTWEAAGRETLISKGDDQVATMGPGALLQVDFSSAGAA